MSLRRTFLTDNQIVNQVNIFFSAGTSWSADTSESVDCAGVSDIFPQAISLLIRANND